jgi:hypothetical protein
VARRFVALSVILTLVTTLNIPAAFTAERFKHLSETGIKRVLLGRTVGDAAHWSYHLAADGRAESIELGKKKPGFWRLSRGELCLEFKDRGKSVTDCYEVWSSGKEIRFLRNGVPVIEGMLLDE